MKSIAVTDFLDYLNHPLRELIEQLRTEILSAGVELSENVKWNAPNYSVEGQDRLTLRIMPPSRQVQLVFHRGAQKQVQPPQRLIESAPDWLVWKENDRAIAAFSNLQELEARKTDLAVAIRDWIAAS